MTSLGQGLLKRHPNMTKQDFSRYWETKHGPKAIPWFLSCGIIYYAQIHNPRQVAKDSAIVVDSKTINVEDYDGAAEMIVESQEAMVAAMQDPYYLEVILPDEKRFLVSAALEHICRVPVGTIEGDKKILIENGKALVDCDEEWKVWEKWQEKRRDKLGE